MEPLMFPEQSKYINNRKKLALPNPFKITIPAQNPGLPMQAANPQMMNVPPQ